MVKTAEEVYTKLKEAGKKIFVLTAGHDYNEYGRGYKNDEFVKTTTMKIKRFLDSNKRGE